METIAFWLGFVVLAALGFLGKYAPAIDAHLARRQKEKFAERMANAQHVRAAREMIHSHDPALGMYLDAVAPLEK